MDWKDGLTAAAVVGLGYLGIKRVTKGAESFSTPFGRIEGIEGLLLKYPMQFAVLMRGVPGNYSATCGGCGGYLGDYEKLWFDDENRSAWCPHCMTVFATNFLIAGREDEEVLERRLREKFPRHFKDAESFAAEDGWEVLTCPSCIAPLGASSYNTHENTNIHCMKCMEQFDELKSIPLYYKGKKMRAESFSAEYKTQINELLDNLYDVAENYQHEPCDCTFEDGTDAEYTFHLDKCHLPYLENKYYDTIDKIWPILKRQGDIDPSIYEWLSHPLEDDGQDANLTVKAFVEQFPLDIQVTQDWTDFEAESFSADCSLASPCPNCPDDTEHFICSVCGGLGDYADDESNFQDYRMSDREGSSVWVQWALDNDIDVSHRDCTPLRDELEREGYTDEESIVPFSADTENKCLVCDEIIQYPREAGGEDIFFNKHHMDLNGENFIHKKNCWDIYTSSPSWEDHKQYWMEAESFSADSISICGVCSVAGHQCDGQITGCPCCEMTAKRESQRPTCNDCGKLKSSTPQEYNRWTCWPCRDAAGGGYHGTECYCNSCMGVEYDEDYNAESFSADEITCLRRHCGGKLKPYSFCKECDATPMENCSCEVTHPKYEMKWICNFCSKQYRAESFAADDWECKSCGATSLNFYEHFDKDGRKDTSLDGFFCANCELSPCGIYKTDSEPCTCDISEYGKYTFLGRKPHPRYPSQFEEDARIRILGKKSMAETHAYSYAYNEGHSDSRKRKEYRPNLTTARQESDFKRILKQKGD